MTKREHKTLEQAKSERGVDSMIGNLALIILLIILTVLMLAPVDAWK